MKSLLEYKNLIMSTGLIPAIVCMIFCIFFQDAVVLYVCSLASIIYILYRLVKPPVYQPNLVLLHGTLALIIASIIKGISGDMLIPDRTVPITLEILILCFSLLYLMVPNFYTKLFSYFHYKISILNCWATQVIAVLSGIHLFASCIIYLFFSPLSYNTLYAMTHIIPPLIYVICIIVNHAFVKTISLTYKKMPFLRIAPICNGKIYVAPRSYQGEEPGKLDIPMEDYIYACKTDTDKYAKEVENKYSNHITGQPEPRFSLKHLVKETNGVKKMPFLRIAPICNGKIYVAPRSYQGEEPGKLDIPMEDYIYACKTDTDKYAKEVENKYSNHITGQPEPRFSLKHLVKETNGVKKTIMLYILPLNDEEQIHFTGGKFVTPEEIEMNSAQYSSFLKEEIDHLNIVTQMWEEFK